MKKKLSIIAIVIIVLIGIYLIGSGFIKSTSVYVSDFNVSEDGKNMLIKLEVASSVGYVRKVGINQQQDGKIYLDCYSGFGGINGLIGAKQEYIIPISEDAETIAILRDKNTYEEVLKKDSNGNWQRVK